MCNYHSLSVQDLVNELFFISIQFSNQDCKAPNCEAHSQLFITYSFARSFWAFMFHHTGFWLVDGIT